MVAMSRDDLSARQTAPQEASRTQLPGPMTMRPLTGTLATSLDRCIILSKRGVTVMDNRLERSAAGRDTRLHRQGHSTKPSRCSNPELPSRCVGTNEASGPAGQAAVRPLFGPLQRRGRRAVDAAQRLGGSARISREGPPDSRSLIPPTPDTRVAKLISSFQAGLLAVLAGTFLFTACHADSGSRATYDGDAGAAASSFESSGIFYWCGTSVCYGSYEVVDDQIVVEGDISLGTWDEAWAESSEAQAFVQGWIPKSTLDTTPRRKWGGNCTGDDDCDHTARIRYRFDGDFASPANATRRAQVQQAIDIWNSLTPRTGIRWDEVPDLSELSSGVRFDFTPGSNGCNSKGCGAVRDRTGSRT